MSLFAHSSLLKNNVDYGGKLWVRWLELKQLPYTRGELHAEDGRNKTEAAWVPDTLKATPPFPSNLLLDLFYLFILMYEENKACHFRFSYFCFFILAELNPLTPFSVLGGYVPVCF